MSTSLTLPSSEVVLAIGVEFDSIWLPVGSIGVESITEATSSVAGSSVWSCSMGRSVNNITFSANEFHDVDFSAFGPSDLSDVGAEHPESWPHALASWELGSNLEFTVGWVIVTGWVDLGWGVWVTSVVFTSGSDNQIASVNSDVVLSISVVLQFVITESTVSNVNGPLVSIEGISVEIINEGFNPSLSISDSEAKDSS